MITAHTHDQSLAREGRIFDIRFLYPSTAPLANGANCDILVVVGDTGFHATSVVAAVGTMEVYGYHSTVVSANGDEIIPFNRNPGEAARRGYTPEVKFYHAPTITDDGAEMYTDIVPAGASSGNTSSAAEQDQGVGYYLTPNTTFLIRVKNVSGAAAVMHHRITGHEGF